jgi:predicted acylesterase/phospholipase RssA
MGGGLISAMSAAAESSPRIEKTREVRLGLVMYGGVSLAVYINGVAHELFRAVRGRGVYRLIKALTKSDVTVDVLSGTSAGGINGIFLAYALCNRVEFGECAALWRKHGDIDKLLRPVGGPAGAYTSLLDSETFYQPRLVEAFQAMGDHPCPVDPKEDVTETVELDLIVTGTDFNGRISDTVDDRGDVIQVKDHRTLFWLKHRAGRKHPFAPGALPNDAPPDGKPAPNPDTHVALAKLARITSCFPAAFSPVTVAPEGDGPDARLRLWGALAGDNERVFIDGGVLDNKPFTSTLDAIYHRTADRPVARRLLYVEPDPERFDPEAKPVVPNIVQAALDSLTRLPGYESIAADLRSLMEHNDQVERLKQIAETVGDDLPPPGGGDANREPTISETVYRRARLSGLVDGVLSELFQRPRDGATREALTAMRTWFQETLVEPVRGGEKVLHGFDVDFRLRRLFALLYACETELLSLRPLMDTLNNQVQVLETIRWAMKTAVGFVAAGQPKAPAMTWHAVAAAVSRVLAVAAPDGYASPDPAKEMLDPTARDAFKQTLDAALVALRAAKPDDPVPAPTLLEEADRFVDRLLEVARSTAGADRKPMIDRVVASDRGFRGRDQVLYPLEVVSGIHERDLIRTVRISPRDAQEGLSHRPLEKKVTGVNVGHFGAFFKRSWRSNDILWGRLDGACELIDTLLDCERVAALAAGKEWVVPPLDPYLPELSAEQRTKLQAALQALTGETDPKNVEAKLVEVRKLLIESAHREILVEGLSQVVEDAAEQQMLWNAYEGRTVERPERSSAFQAGPKTLDPAVVATASADAARAVVGEMVAERPPERLVAFFKNKYAVGEETLEQVPRVVLLDVVARALLVVRNSLLEAAGGRADSVRDSFVYKVFLDWPLRALAALAGGLRRTPSSQAAVIVAAVLYIAISAAVVVNTAPGYKSLAEVPYWGAALFVGLPLLLGATVGFLISGRNDGSKSEKTGRALWALLKSAVAALALVGLVALWLMPSDQLCTHALGGLLPAGTPCPSWAEKLIGAGKVVLGVGALLTAPFLQLGAWMGRRPRG